MAFPFLLLAAATVVAVATGDDEPDVVPFQVYPGGLARPGRAPGRAVWQATTADAAVDVVVAEVLTAYAGDDEPAVMSIEVPAAAQYTVMVRAMRPDIGLKIRIAGTKYGRGLGPSGSAPVVGWVAKAVSIAGDAAAPATPGDAYDAAAAAGDSVLSAVVAGIGGVIKRARVAAWAKFRTGSKGSGSERAAIRAANAKWFSPTRLTAASVANPAGQWRYEGSGPGLWQMVDGQSNVSAQPDVRAEPIGGDYLRLTITSGASVYAGEVRYDAVVAGVRA